MTCCNHLTEHLGVVCMQYCCFKYGKTLVQIAALGLAILKGFLVVHLLVLYV